jgi:hypothetical protein
MLNDIITKRKNKMKNQLKHCNKCGNDYPYTLEFWPARTKSKTGLDTTCRNCCRDYMKQRRKNPELKKRDNDACKEWYKKNPKYTTRSNRLLKFNITPDRYNTMILEQNGVCAICKKSESATINNVTKSLAVDHCHNTNKVRGLLCSRCNTALGLLKDDISVVKNMINYLQKNL